MAIQWRQAAKKKDPERAANKRRETNNSFRSLSKAYRERFTQTALDRDIGAYRRKQKKSRLITNYRPFYLLLTEISSHQGKPYKRSVSKTRNKDQRVGASSGQPKRPFKTLNKQISASEQNCG